MHVFKTASPGILELVVHEESKICTSPSHTFTQRLFPFEEWAPGIIDSYIIAQAVSPSSSIIVTQAVSVTPV